MDKIKIKFTGMGGNFDDKDNFITKILQERYVISVEEDPDFLFYSVNSSDYLNYDCVRIFYTAENIVPDFNICDYAIGFHYLNFADRYIRYPLYLVDGFRAYAGDDYALDLQLALQKHKIEDDILNRKSEFCSFVYSNAKAAQCRGAIFDALSHYKRVNSAGRYRNNVGRPLENKLEFQKKHKEVQPVVAICYDFDKTLSPDDMQAQGFIQSVGYDVADFWTASNGLATNNAMDQNLAYMYMMKENQLARFFLQNSSLQNTAQRFNSFLVWKSGLNGFGCMAKRGTLLWNTISFLPG